MQTRVPGPSSHRTKRGRARTRQRELGTAEVPVGRAWCLRLRRHGCAALEGQLRPRVCPRTLTPRFHAETPQRDELECLVPTVSLRYLSFLLALEVPENSEGSAVPDRSQGRGGGAVRVGGTLPAQSSSGTRTAAGRAGLQAAGVAL